MINVLKFPAQKNTLCDILKKHNVSTIISLDDEIGEYIIPYFDKRMRMTFYLAEDVGTAVVFMRDSIRDIGIDTSAAKSNGRMAHLEQEKDGLIYFFAINNASVVSATATKENRSQVKKILNEAGFTL